MDVVLSKERAQDSTLHLPRVAGLRHIAFVSLAIGATVGLQAITLRHFFFFDDYVPFGEIARQSQRDYVWRLLTSTDLTPNWRPLPGLLYLASYDYAGMDPLPVHALMVA